MASRIFNTFSSLALSLCFMFMVFTIGPILESKFFPVVSHMKYANITKEGDDFLLFSFLAQNNRECSLVSLSAVSGDFLQPAVSSIDVEPREAAYGPKPKSNHLQDYGIWAIKPKGDYVRIIATHSCHPFWDTKTLFFEWRQGFNPNETLTTVSK